MAALNAAIASINKQFEIVRKYGTIPQSALAGKRKLEDQRNELFRIIKSKNIPSVCYQNSTDQQRVSANCGIYYPYYFRGWHT